MPGFSTRAALEGFESWVRLNVDSTAYPVASTLADLRTVRERRPIFWEGHPKLVGCYELAIEATETRDPLMERIERLIYLSEVPVRSGMFGSALELVARAAPKQEASDFTSLMWFVTDEGLSVTWRMKPD